MIARHQWDRLVRTTRYTAAIALSALVPLAAHAQTRSLAGAVRSAPDGKVRFSFASRPDVCGNGNSISTSGNHSGSWNGNQSSPDVEWNDDCDHGPVRVVLSVQNHAVTGMHTYVGGRWRPATSGVTDVGTVSPKTATDYLLTLARQGAPDVAKKAILPTALADSVTVWPELLAIARDGHVAHQVRRDAVFWLGQFAGNAATANLTSLVANDTLDRDVREAAVFALSQRPNHEGVPTLIHVAQTDRDPQMRRRAIFWLGQSDDPRALALFERLLTQR